MLAGRLSRVAQRTSSVHLAHALRPTSCGFIRQYSAPAQAAQRHPSLEVVPDEVFSKYNLEKSVENLPVVRALEMVREAEAIITGNNEFDRAEAMLTGALDFIGKSGIKDPWIVGSAHANLAYALQQNYKYDAAMSNYGIGLQNLTQEPVKDPRFVGIRQLGFAELLSLQGEHGMAATTCQAAVAQLEKVLQSDPLVGIAYSNLAAYRMLEGKATQAVAHAEKALAVLEATLGKHNEVTRNCAVNLSKLYKDLGRQEQVESLDNRFLQDDQPILAPQTGNYAPEYLQSLKNKWRKQGPRKIFDPPGLHRSSSLSANSYNAFVKAWKSKGLPISSAAAGVLTNEFKSLDYSHDQLQRFIGRPLPKEFRDAPEKYKTGFENLKVNGITSLAKELDKQATLPPLLPEDVIITPEEWKDAAERQREFKAKHGDPLLEAAQEEFSRSEEFFEGVDESGETKKKKRDLFAEEEEDYGAEEKPQEKKITIGEQPLEDIDAETIADEEELEYEREERKTDAILDRLEQQDSADLAYGWDKDTYDAYRASHGDSSIRETEKKDSERWLKSHRGNVELEEEETTIFDSCSDEELAKAEDLLKNGRFTQEGLNNLSRWMGRSHGLVSNDPEVQKALRDREDAKNPHYLKYAGDYVANEGIPTTYEILDEPNDEDMEELMAEMQKTGTNLSGIELGEDLTPEELAEIEKLEAKLKSPRAVVVDRPTPQDIDELSEMAEFDSSDEVAALRGQDQALKYKERVRKQIAEGAPSTPDTEYEREEMAFEKQVNENLRKNLLASLEQEKEKRVQDKLVKNKGKTNPYDYNEDEDDVFEYGKENTTVKRSTAIRRAEDKARIEAQNQEKSTKPKYGRLHDTPWHDDFESE